ncbi:TAXI family TRAP transporter solute-binding subunit [Isoptericola sp. QY 916]|uniref:TAXI family TRAP transporter solute-binding subunit n=1 Tax=Isoptericola sp. QY 916 TaxID=2782570 RepID=UPI003D30107C|nr:TAXI family TRAP transporter solute-binding subunit [Isoptericola sp. QY 916]
MRAGSTADRSRAARLATLLVTALVALPLLTACVGDDGAGDPWDGQRPDALTVATGGSTGIYHAYGTALAQVLEDRYDVPVVVDESGGSVENLDSLDAGTAQVAFSAADAARDAVAGEGEFDEPLEVRALARVYDDFLHLVVPAGSRVRTIDDLRGRRVSLGAPQSGTALIAHRLLMAADVPAEDLTDVSLGLDGSIEALRAGEIDAFFWSGGLRTPGLTALADDVPVRLVPLGDLVEDVRSRYGSGYRHGIVPEGIYGSSRAVETLAVPNFLMVRADMPDAEARTLVSTLFDARGQIAEQVPSAANLDRVRAIFTDPVELHPGALRYYRVTKD